MFTALVVKGAKRMCPFLFAQDLMYAFDVSLRPKAQVLEYRVSPHRRHSIELDCWVQQSIPPATAAAASVSYQAPLALETSVGAFCSFAAAFGCAGQEQLNPAVAVYLQQQELQLLQPLGASDGAKTSSCWCNGRSSSSSSSSTAVALATVTPAAAILLHDRWSPTAPCRLHGSSHANGDCRLQQGQQQRCTEAQYAAAFTAAGLLFGLDERYHAYSSAFSTGRRLINEHSSQSGGVLQQAAMPFNGDPSEVYIPPEDSPGQGIDESTDGSGAGDGDPTDAETGASSTYVLPSGTFAPVLATGNEWDAAADAALQQAYAQQLQVLTVQLLCDGSVAEGVIRLHIRVLQEPVGSTGVAAALAGGTGGTAAEQDKLQQQSFWDMLQDEEDIWVPGAFHKGLVRFSQAVTFTVGCFFSIFTVWITILLFGLQPCEVLQMLFLSQQWARLAWHDYAEPKQQQQQPAASPDRANRVAPRCRKKARLPWYAAWWRRLQMGSPCTGAQQRRARQLGRNTQQHSNPHSRRRSAVVLETLGLRVLWPLLLLFLLMLASSALAAPFTSTASVEGLQLMTGNLAAWEFSKLARYRFRGYSYLP